MRSTHIRENIDFWPTVHAQTYVCGIGMEEKFQELGFTATIHLGVDEIECFPNNYSFQGI